MLERNKSGKMFISWDLSHIFHNSYIFKLIFPFKSNMFQKCVFQIPPFPWLKYTSSVCSLNKSCKNTLWYQIMQIGTHLDPTPVRVTWFYCPQICKWFQSYIFMVSYKLTIHNLWHLFVTFDLHLYIDKPISSN